MRGSSQSHRARRPSPPSSHLLVSPLSSFEQPPSARSLPPHCAAAIATFLPFHRAATVGTSKPPSRTHVAASSAGHSVRRCSITAPCLCHSVSLSPFCSAARLLLTPSLVGASKLTRSLTQLTSQTLSNGSIVAGLAYCLRREALFHRRRRHLCFCLHRQLSVSSAVSFLAFES
ncbi:uncharacterized protein LOC130936541 isoform X2 [Arachis stenosperma]|nr:uncharacterized protein LOC130936541 isoform X2 [Arachis stenosperma]